MMREKIMDHLQDAHLGFRTGVRHDAEPAESTESRAATECVEAVGGVRGCPGALA